MAHDRCCSPLRVAVSPRTAATRARSPRRDPQLKAAPANACALLPAAEVGGIIERAVRDSLAMQLPDGGAGGATVSQCNYSTAETGGRQPHAPPVSPRRNGPAQGEQERS